MEHHHGAAACLVFTLLTGVACGRGGDNGSTPLSSGAAAPVLLFNGTGSSPNDVRAVQSVLTTAGLHFSTADSSQLNGMDESQLRRFQLLIVPGGNFVDMGNGLSPATTVSVRHAVQRGLNYLGLCAGGFLAGDSPYNGLNLTSGVRFGFYAIEKQGMRKAAVSIAVRGGPTLDHYWEDGPQFTGWGTPVATYPDGTPAVVEGSAGKGWVVLTGIHPEAPEDWRRGMTFATPASVDNAYAATLVRAALNGTALSRP
jgi:glutamine amidotransferase-like uncharacterized protein